MRWVVALAAMAEIRIDRVLHFDLLVPADMLMQGLVGRVPRASPKPEQKLSLLS
jgi:hypothetical protein